MSANEVYDHQVWTGDAVCFYVFDEVSGYVVRQYCRGSVLSWGGKLFLSSV